MHDGDSNFASGSAVLDWLCVLEPSTCFKVLTFCSVGRPAAYCALPGLPVPTVGQEAQSADL
jgi:hypothetical protein